MSHGNAPLALEPKLIDATSFVGRDAEVAEVTSCLAGGWRLITLFGPPGVGKTRLVRRVAHELPSVLFVDLADVRTRDGLVTAVGAALAVSLAADDGDDAVLAVASALTRASVGEVKPVIVLDNIEQIEGAAATVATWLEKAPGAAFVATSRARLRLPGERVVEVGPLSVSSAIALFEERVRAGLGRPLIDAERADAEALVKRLDGIPLAIELAAGRAAMLGVADVLVRLAKGVDVLQNAPIAPTGDADGGEPLARHASARAAVSWSWELLSMNERRVLAQASVFCGGFTLMQAEDVVDLPGDEVMNCIQSLRERSLLWARRERASVRFGLFEIVRDFGKAALMSGVFGAQSEVEARHAKAFEQALAGVAAKARTDDPSAVELLLNEAENLEVAFARSVALTDKNDPHADDVVTASLALQLSTMFRRRGARASHEHTLRSGLEAAQRAKRPDLESDLLQARAALASAAGEIAVARDCQERALIVAEQSGDVRRGTFARARRGWDRFELGELDAGLVDMRTAADDAAKNRDVEREAYARDRLGLALVMSGSTTSGVDELTKAATLAAHTHDRWLRQKTLVDLAWTHRRLGAIEPAAQRLLELGALGKPLDGTAQASIALEHAALARATGRLEDALRLADEAVSTADDTGAPRLRALLRIERAAILLDLGRPSDAIAVLDEALALAARVENPNYRAAALLELARARHDAGDIAGAGAALDLGESALAQGKDALLSGALHCERAMLLAQTEDPRARTSAELALTVLQRVGGKPLIVGLCVAGLLDGSRLDERRTAAESLAARFSDVESRAAVAMLRGQSASDTALARRLQKIRGARPHREMVVGADGRFYELDGQRVSLQRQRSLRLILLALVEQAERAPGVGLPQTEVVARGWPGEKMRADSGATRVYTSIRRLRRGGLAGVLLTRDDGYLIDPAVVVKRA